jgi:hypothetical protein
MFKKMFLILTLLLTFSLSTLNAEESNLYPVGEDETFLLDLDSLTPINPDDSKKMTSFTYQIHLKSNPTNDVSIITTIEARPQAETHGLIPLGFDIQILSMRTSNKNIPISSPSAKQFTPLEKAYSKVQLAHLLAYSEMIDRGYTFKPLEANF